MPAAPSPISIAARTRTGMMMALAGFALLSMGDGLIKSIAGGWPGTAVATLRYIIGTIVLAALLAARHGRAGFTTSRPGLHFARGASVALGSACFFISIFLMPLADATAIQFTNPMFVALASALFMGEKASRAVWAATCVAFVGVLIVLRPQVADMGLAALLPMGTALCMAGTMIFNRMAAGEGDVLKMQFLITAMAVPVLIAVTLLGHLSGMPSLHVTIPDASVVLKCSIVAVTASVAHGLLFMATEQASAASIAPMTYIQLLVSAGIGMAVYQDWPDAPAIAGACLIVGAGLWLWRKQR